MLLAPTSTQFDTFSDLLGKSRGHHFRNLLRCGTKNGVRSCNKERGQVLVCHDARNAKRKEEARRSVQNFIEDEGRPLGVGVQAQASNHLKLRG